jgi:hypothetical protein
VIAKRLENPIIKAAVIQKLMLMPPYRYIPFPMANSGSSNSGGPSLTGGLMLFGGLLLTYHLGKKLIEELRKGGAERRADDSPEVQQAMLLRMAMNPSGVSWMKSFDAHPGGQDRWKSAG